MTHMNALDVTYRKTAAAGASGLALLIALYDTLAGDLRRCGSAQRAGDLAQRAREVSHALSIIAVLENWLEADSGALAAQLAAFYTSLRRMLIEAQARQSAQKFDELMSQVLTVREVWQQMQSQIPAQVPQVLPPVARQHSAPFSFEPEKRSSWSA